MSHELANSMRTQIMEEMRARNLHPRGVANHPGMLDALFSDGDMRVSTAQHWARALGCHWEARLHQRETVGEAVALVRDAP